MANQHCICDTCQSPIRSLIMDSNVIQPHALEENYALATNQFTTTCDYLSFATIIGYFYNYFWHLVMLATTLQLTCD